MYTYQPCAIVELTYGFFKNLLMSDFLSLWFYFLFYFFYETWNLVFLFRIESKFILSVWPFTLQR